MQWRRSQIEVFPMEESDNLNDDEREEAEMLTQAFLQFTHHFQEYIKEINPELWKRAVDYAKTFTDVEGVEFTYVDLSGNTAEQAE
jgi:hypothetical protein